MYKLNNILMYSTDPGAANVIGSMYLFLKDYYEVDIYGDSYAIEKYMEFGILGKEVFKSKLEEVNEERIRQFILETSPRLIITGTAAQHNIEKMMWKIAKEEGIDTIAIIDQWVNYKIRFSDKTVVNLDEEYSIKYLPTKIFIMDEMSKQELINIGFKEEVIDVVGHPYFQYIYENMKINVVKKKQDFRILFCSEPISKTYKDNNMFWGYNEKTILLNILEALNEIDMRDISLVIRKHPKEDSEFHEKIITSYSQKFSIELDEESNSIESILKSDIVIGMSSMILLEAIVLGKNVISVQIGLKRKNPFILDKLGINNSIVSKEKLKEKLIDLRKNEEIKVDINFLKEYFKKEYIIKKVGDMI